MTNEIASWAYSVGGISDRGPRALILHHGSVVGETSMAVAGRIVQAMNDAEAVPGTPNQIGALHEVVKELHAMLDQHIQTRAQTASPSSTNDDAKRARQLLERAGRIAQGIEP